MESGEKDFGFGGGAYSSEETMNPLTDAIKMGVTPENILVDEYPRNDIWASESAQDPQGLPEIFSNIRWIMSNNL